MISQNMLDAINKQINRELYSEYLYLSMAAYLENEGLAGFANFMRVQVQEERFHAMKMFDYILERGGKVVLEQIDQPQVDFESVLEIFTLSLGHEKFISKSINELMDVAIVENDHATRSFLNWFIDEQVEEEASMDNLVNQLKLIGGKGHGMLMMDRELKQRVFNAPANA